MNLPTEQTKLAATLRERGDGSNANLSMFIWQEPFLISDLIAMKEKKHNSLAATQDNTWRWMQAFLSPSLGLLNRIWVEPAKYLDIAATL